MKNRTILSLVACAALLGCVTDETGDAPHRIVVIGDIHADLGAARGAFQLAGATNSDDEWIGGDLVVVQLGDLIGRSFEDREVLDFIFELQGDAEKMGGQVHVLIGNHEVFGARLRLDHVDPNAYSAFENMTELDVDDSRLAHLPVKQRARGAALISGGYYAKRLSVFPAVLRLGDTVFVHGGVTPYWANYGIDRINEEVRQWFAGNNDEPRSVMGADAGNPDDVVMMSRQFSEDVSEADCEMLRESLRILNAKRMIVAHSVQQSITAYCGEQVWAVDVGMSRFYGGSVQVLEITNDEIFVVKTN